MKYIFWKFCYILKCCPLLLRIRKKKKKRENKKTKIPKFLIFFHLSPCLCKLPSLTIFLLHDGFVGYLPIAKRNVNTHVGFFFWRCFVVLGDNMIWKIHIFYWIVHQHPRCRHSVGAIPLKIGPLIDLDSWSTPWSNLI